MRKTESSITHLQAWARSFFSAVDAQKADDLRDYFTDDVVFRMANAEPLNGVDTLLDAFGQADLRFTSITHDVTGIWRGTWAGGDVVSVEALVTYTSAEAEPVTLPVTSTLRLNGDGRIADYRIFIEPSPAFA